MKLKLMQESSFPNLTDRIIRGAQEASAKGNRGTSEDSASLLSNARMGIALAERAKDQLPPLTSYRQGWLARLELRVKDFFRRATHWYVWEQKNYNAAVCSVLRDLVSAVELQERERRRALEAAPSMTTLPDLCAALDECVQRISKLETAVADLQVSDHERRKYLETIKDEHRVCYKQLSLELKEVLNSLSQIRRTVSTELARLSQDCACSATETPTTQGTSDETERRASSPPASDLQKR